MSKTIEPPKVTKEASQKHQKGIQKIQTEHINRNACAMAPSNSMPLANEGCERGSLKDLKQKIFKEPAKSPLTIATNEVRHQPNA